MPALLQSNFTISQSFVGSAYIFADFSAPHPCVPGVPSRAASVLQTSRWGAPPPGEPARLSPARTLLRSSSAGVVAGDRTNAHGYFRNASQTAMPGSGFPGWGRDVARSTRTGSPAVVLRGFSPRGWDSSCLISAAECPRARPAPARPTPDSGLLGPGDHALPGSALCNTPAAPGVLWSPFVTSSATRCPGSWPSRELFVLEVGGDLFQTHVVTFDNLLSPIVVISSYFKAFRSNHLRHSPLIPAANFRRQLARRPSGHRLGAWDSGNHSPPSPGSCKSKPRTRARVGLVPEAPLPACGWHLLPVSSRGRPPVHVCILLSPHKDTGQRG